MQKCRVDQNEEKKINKQSHFFLSRINFARENKITSYFLTELLKEIKVSSSDNK